MFAARKRIFVDCLPRRVPVIAEAFERGQFEGGDTTCLIVTNDDGRHSGALRLASSTPRFKGSLFADLCAGPIPRSHDTREILRFCIDQSLSRSQRRLATGIYTASHEIRDAV
jgi:N-acyl-L-homoserine lactone synthetase